MGFLNPVFSSVRLFDGMNITTDDKHMWLIPFTSGSDHTLTVRSASADDRRIQNMELQQIAWRLLQRGESQIFRTGFVQFNRCVR